MVVVLRHPWKELVLLLATSTRTSNTSSSTVKFGGFQNKHKKQHLTLRTMASKNPNDTCAVSILTTGTSTTGMENHTSNDESLFETAVSALMSSVHQSATKEAIQKAAARRTSTIADMQSYLERIFGNQQASTAAQSSPSSSLPWTVFSSDTTSSNTDVTIIHVTGTKGKGSVSAMCESIVRRQHEAQTGKTVNTGLFTSPHLMDIRERIRINGRPVSKSIFGQAYWQVRERLEKSSTTSTAERASSASPARPELNSTTTGRVEDVATNSNPLPELPILPGYFRMLTLVALYIFRNYRDDTENSNPITYVILEVGMGGRYDATNCVPAAACCGITLIDYDHVRVLGHSLPEIAWEKGGIFQVHKGDTYPTTPHPVREKEAYEKALNDYNNEKDSEKGHSQKNLPRHFVLDSNGDDVLDVFRLCADIEGQGGSIQMVGEGKQIAKRLPLDRPLGLPGKHQRLNAELAIALSEAALRQNLGSSSTGSCVKMNDEITFQALADVSWPARCQTVELPEGDGNLVMATAAMHKPVKLRLDGAHTIQSVQAGLGWFLDMTKHDATAFRILLFNCSHERNPIELLELLCRAKFHVVYFCRADSERPSAITKANATDLLQSTGRTVHPDLLLKVDSDECTWQDTLHGIWKHLESDVGPEQWTAVQTRSSLSAQGALEDGLNLGGSFAGANRIEVFVTGSLYLVGSILSAVRWQEPESEGHLLKHL